MDINDLLLKLQTIHLVMIETRQLLAENRNDMAFVKVIEAQNKIEILAGEVRDEIEKDEEDIDLYGPGLCASCPSEEGYWCIDPYMKEVHNETCYLFLCHKCYQDRADDI